MPRGSSALLHALSSSSLWSFPTDQSIFSNWIIVITWAGFKTLRVNPRRGNKLHPHGCHGRPRGPRVILFFRTKRPVMFCFPTYLTLTLTTPYCYRGLNMPKPTPTQTYLYGYTIPAAREDTRQPIKSGSCGFGRKALSGKYIFLFPVGSRRRQISRIKLTAITCLAADPPASPGLLPADGFQCWPEAVLSLSKHRQIHL